MGPFGRLFVSFMVHFVASGVDIARNAKIQDVICHMFGTMKVECPETHPFLPFAHPFGQIHVLPALDLEPPHLLNRNGWLIQPGLKLELRLK